MYNHLCSLYYPRQRPPTGSLRQVLFTPPIRPVKGPDLNTILVVFIDGSVLLQRMHNITRPYMVSLSVTFPAAHTASETQRCPDDRFHEGLDSRERRSNDTDI